MGLYEIAKLLVKSGIADDIKDNNINVLRILDRVTEPKPEGTILTQTINNLMKTNSLRIVMNMGFNAGLKALDENLPASIGTIKYNEEVWGGAETDAQTFASNLSQTYSYFNSLEESTRNTILKFGFDSQMFDALKNVDLNKLVLPAARALDVVNRSAVFNQNPDGKDAENKHIMDRIVDAVYASDMFATAKNISNLMLSIHKSLSLKIMLLILLALSTNCKKKIALT